MREGCAISQFRESLTVLVEQSRDVEATAVYCS
jgi:hypothetical protein